MREPDLQPHVPTLGVSVEAVKEQLLLLGHTIPDDVINAFLDSGLPGRPSAVSMHACLSLPSASQNTVAVPCLDSTEASE